MIQDLYIVQRHKPALFGPANMPVWSTCLRSIAFAKPDFDCAPSDEVYAQHTAYRYLLEVVCGLQSPILGETEVLGQFKMFSQEWLKLEPHRASLVQRILNDAKAIRTEHLQHLGAQSYGSWVRKNLRGPRVHILGGGLLVKEIVPYLQKLNHDIVLHVRDVNKVNFFNGPVVPIVNGGFDGGAVIVAAPMSHESIQDWMGSSAVASQFFDLRDTSSTNPVSLSAATESYRLHDVFAEIEKTKTQLLPRLETVRREIDRRSEKAGAHSQLRPLGWERHMRLKVASRKSDLARWQSLQVARSFASLPTQPQSDFIYKASLGDQDLDTPLANMNQKGVFTEDFYQDLVGGQCDVVVHSWKDLPVDERAQTQISMTLDRADVRDLLLIPESAWQSAVQAGHLQILTSSPRRVYNLNRCLTDLLPAQLTLEFLNVRGNVPTRLGKMREQKRALVLAKAGLDRLLEAEGEGFLADGVSVRRLIQGCRFMVLPISLNPCAAAQGALAVETRREPNALHAMCAQLNHEATFLSVQRERKVLGSYGGGCQQKIGVTVLPRDYGQVVALRGLTEQGEELSRWTIESTTPWRRAKRKEDIFPQRPGENSWFERHRVPPSEDLSDKAALLVAHREAWPPGFRPGDQQLVWTAGVKTWRHLAQEGIWVHGSCEGLGESEAPQLENLVGDIQWTKLSHRHGDSRAARLVATYELKAKAAHPDLSGKTHFFWMSSTSFEAAYKIYPEQINEGFNAAGPGSTFAHLRSLPALQNPPKVFIDLAQFLSESAP